MPCAPKLGDDGSHSFCFGYVDRTNKCIYTIFRENQALQSIDEATLNKVGASCTCFSLRKSARVVTQLFDEIMAPSGLLVTQFSILSVVAAMKESTMNQLAQYLVMDRTTLTRNLKPLERQGLIQIKPGLDKRTRLISLTELGVAALHKALPLWEQAQTLMVSQLGQERWESLMLHLSDITRLLSDR
ncbi:MAG: winged helix-turn-helix transcriptional regulator [Stigonema ocellatum SAG 48.90 = DSM 106950]|nr:winged helix-turn-helix transcriptional regulator [Stigonema ocellatum SAG 48.90 = DSM 106950]